MSRRQPASPVSEAAINEVLDGVLDADAAGHLKRKAEKVIQENMATIKMRLMRVEMVLRAADDMNHPDLVAALQEALATDLPK